MGVLDELAQLLEERIGCHREASEARRPAVEREAVADLLQVLTAAREAAGEAGADVPTIDAVKFGPLGVSADTLRRSVSSESIRGHPSAIQRTLWHDERPWAVVGRRVVGGRFEVFDLAALVPASEWGHEFEEWRDRQRGRRPAHERQSLHGLLAVSLGDRERYVIDTGARLTVRARVTD